MTLCMCVCVHICESSGCTSSYMNRVRMFADDRERVRGDNPIIFVLADSRDMT